MSPFTSVQRTTVAVEFRIKIDYRVLFYLKKKKKQTEINEKCGKENQALINIF